MTKLQRLLSIQEVLCNSKFDWCN